MKITAFGRNDMEELIHLMRETVYAVCKDDYSPEELELWVPKNIDKARFLKSLRHAKVLVAREEGAIVGFADMDADGYLNRLYTRVEYQGRGIGSALLQRMEEEARKNRCGKVFLTSSITARSFYEHHGYVCLGAKEAPRRGGSVPGFRMEKKL